MPAAYVTTREVPISDLTPFPGNAKRGDVASIQASLARNGQYRSLIVRQTDDGELIVLAGNHTMQALAANGNDTARCEIVTCDDAESKRINLADNRLAELGVWDEDALADLLQDLQEDLTGTGYTGDDLDSLLQTTGALAADTNSFLSGFLAPAEPAHAPAPAVAPVSPPPAGGTAPAAAPQQPEGVGPQPPAAPLAVGAPVPQQPDRITDPAPPPAPAGGGSFQFPSQYMATLQWVVTVEQRDTVRAAIKHAQTSHELDSAAEALTEVCRAYLATQENTPS